MPTTESVTYDPKRKVWSTPNYPHWDFINQSVGAAFLKQMRALPANHVLEYYVDTDERITVGQMYRASVAVARNLSRLGLQRGEIVLVYASNNVKVTPLIMGAWLMGARVNIFDTSMVPEYVDATFQLLQPVFIFYEELCASAVADSLKRSPLNCVRYKLSLDDTKFSSELLQPVTEDELANFVPSRVDDPQNESVMLGLTSGTTGPPKVADISHSLLLHGASTFLCHTILTTPPFVDTTIFAFSPLRWISQVNMMLISLLFGAKRVCATKPANGPYGCDIIKKTRVTHLFLAPQFFYKILDTLAENDTESMSVLRSIQIGGEAPSTALRALVRKHCVNAKIYCTFGMTELSGVIAQDEHINAGKLVSGLQMQILDDHMQPLGPNQRGRLYIKSPVPYKPYLKIDSSGYYFADGFFLNGDYGYVDEQNNLHVESRYKDLVRTKDVIIIPNNVENLIGQLPEVAMAQLVGFKKSKDSTADACALFVKLKNASNTSPESVIKKIRTDLTHKLGALENSRIEKIHIVSKMPLTSCGKIDRIELQRHASAMAYD
ncbi:uncharacterized protein LOC101455476 [Ceratitis capitata]|uniref:uncharacterized protein LOC101455476 n=1 Tax=Ceratitis capitata TaxID=7213 RepID=UPI000329FD9E|nr:uncharacterized protein LOC101455476 [Ceratitis capitata]